MTLRGRLWADLPEGASRYVDRDFELFRDVFRHGGDARLSPGLAPALEDPERDQASNFGMDVVLVATNDRAPSGRRPRVVRTPATALVMDELMRQHGSTAGSIEISIKEDQGAAVSGGPPDSAAQSVREIDEAELDVSPPAQL